MDLEITIKELHRVLAIQTLLDLQIHVKISEKGSRNNYRRTKKNVSNLGVM